MRDTHSNWKIEWILDNKSEKADFRWWRVKKRFVNVFGDLRATRTLDRVNLRNRHPVVNDELQMSAVMCKRRILPSGFGNGMGWA